MYPVHRVPPGPPVALEQLGAKFKFWYQDPDHGLTLFKQGRPGTGENWAEKVACELATLIDLPHAQYELAVYEQMEGVVSRSLVSEGARLVHANELLANVAQDYQRHETANYRQSDHTLRRVLSYFRLTSDTLKPPYGYRAAGKIFTAFDFFIGYLMFDAWIANQDRHDLNWGILRANDGDIFLSPSYDHGSSMGRNESDESKKQRMTTKDMGRHIKKYVTTARSALYPHQITEGKCKALLTLEAFSLAAEKNIEAGIEWQQRLHQVEKNDVLSIIENIPQSIMSDISKEFTLEILMLNRIRILDLEIKK